VQRRRQRVPFGSLLEYGLLLPGQQLYFDECLDIPAIILANGHIRYQGVTGSIHQVAKQIQNAPCNGWEHWYFCKPDSDELVVIDRLRQRLRDGDAG
jgi:modification methylase